MRPAMARHDEILREAIEAHGGHVVKTTGDGVHAAFATAADAVDAAVAAQRAIGAQEWPLPAPLRVRMGIHSGPAELRDGDYYGTSVNRSARIMSVAHGGQVVISLATQELAQAPGSRRSISATTGSRTWVNPSGSSRSFIPSSTGTSPRCGRSTCSRPTCRPR